MIFSIPPGRIAGFALSLRAAGNRNAARLNPNQMATGKAPSGCSSLTCAPRLDQLVDAAALEHQVPRLDLRAYGRRKPLVAAR